MPGLLPASLRQSVVCPTLCLRQRFLLSLTLQVELCLSYLLLASGRVFSFPTLCLRQRCLLHLTLQFRQNYVLPPSPTTSLIEFCLSCAPGTDVCFAVCPSSGKILSILCMQSLVCPTSCPQSVCSALSLSCLQLPLKIGIIMSVPPVPFSSSFVCPALCLRDVCFTSVQVELCLFCLLRPLEFCLSCLVPQRCLFCINLGRIMSVLCLAPSDRVQSILPCVSQVSNLPQSFNLGRILSVLPLTSLRQCCICSILYLRQRCLPNFVPHAG